MPRPLPLAACMQFARSGHAPHTSGSQWTVTPGSTCPAGQVMLSIRMSVRKSALEKSPGRLTLCAHGLANMVPPSAAVDVIVGNVPCSHRSGSASQRSRWEAVLRRIASRQSKEGLLDSIARKLATTASSNCTANEEIGLRARFAKPGCSEENSMSTRSPTVARCRAVVAAVICADARCREGHGNRRGTPGRPLSWRTVMSQSVLYSTDVMSPSVRSQCQRSKGRTKFRQSYERPRLSKVTNVASRASSMQYAMDSSSPRSRVAVGASGRR
jgi:hypothetical protein